ncbi:TPA: hypothetical protein VDT24_005565 [Pseudomonas aeruginosa]|uniref:Uncharacterized protein n=1 Tax=Alcaligenes xylosoxydans xylosoxydans TaxID=85698 RepID=A0A193PML0_ALCXX|nr:Tn21 protein of unknown function Urf2 [Achromobacter xylosoxidans]HEP8040825.1 hypothetical protein [Pseudomonas aeruginosa]
MKLRNSFPLAAVAALLMASTAHAGQDADASRFSIMAPVQAAYDAYQVTASRAQNTMDSIEAELREPGLSAERRELLAVSLATLRAREAAALERLHAESALAVIFRRRLHQLIGRNGCCAASS